VTEVDLIKKIKKLREIKPRKDWVLLTKTQILGQEPKFELFPFFKPVYAGVFCLLILISLFEFSQGALPGEPLYLIKRIVEKGQAMLVSDEEKPTFNLELANKRLEELSKIAEKNEVRKLPPAINEFQTNVSEAARNLARVQKVDEEFVAQAKIFQDSKAKVEESLGTQLETKELEDNYKIWAAKVIKDLENSSLTENQEEL